MINPLEFRTIIIRPTLQYLDPYIIYSLAAENLLLCTALVESGLEHLVQSGGGPALGFYQIEPLTADDCWTNWINDRSALRKKIGDLLYTGFFPMGQLQGNLLYATAIARVIYRRAKPPLPAATDWPALGQYWVDHYNKGGAGTVQRFMSVINAAGVV